MRMEALPSVEGSPVMNLTEMSYQGQHSTWSRRADQELDKKKYILINHSTVTQSVQEFKWMGLNTPNC